MHCNKSREEKNFQGQTSVRSSWCVISIMSCVSKYRYILCNKFYCCATADWKVSYHTEGCLDAFLQCSLRQFLYFSALFEVSRSAVEAKWAEFDLYCLLRRWKSESVFAIAPNANSDTKNRHESGKRIDWRSWTTLFFICFTYFHAANTAFFLLGTHFLCVVDYKLFFLYRRFFLLFLLFC